MNSRDLFVRYGNLKSACLAVFLLLADGWPEIFFTNAPDNSESDVRLVFSSSVSGSQASDWSSEINVDTPNEVGIIPAATLLNGRPAVVYLDDTNARLRFAASSSPGGELSEDWTWEEVTGSDGARFNLAVANNGDRPVVAYFSDTGDDLFYAIRS